MQSSEAYYVLTYFATESCKRNFFLKTYNSKKTYHISATKINRLIMFMETLFIVRTTRNTQAHSVGGMQSCSTLQQVVHIEPLGFRVTLSGNIPFVLIRSRMSFLNY
jgi:hypothetical protein